MKKEFPYLILCAVLCAVLIAYSFNFLLILEDATLDISMHNIDFLAVLLDSFTSAFALVYFFRILYTKFKNRFVNYLYIIFNGLFIIAISISIRSMYRLIETLETIGLNEHLGFSQHLYVLAAIAVAAIVLEIYTILQLRKQKQS